MGFTQTKLNSHEDGSNQMTKNKNKTKKTQKPGLLSKLGALQEEKLHSQRTASPKKKEQSGQWKFIETLPRVPAARLLRRRRSPCTSRTRALSLAPVPRSRLGATASCTQQSRGQPSTVLLVRTRGKVPGGVLGMVCLQPSSSCPQRTASCTAWAVCEGLAPWVTRASSQKVGLEALKSVLGLSLPSAELVFGPRVFQFQFSLLGLQERSGVSSGLAARRRALTQRRCPCCFQEPAKIILSSTNPARPC